MTPEDQAVQDTLTKAKTQAEALQVSAKALSEPSKVPTLTPPAIATPPRTGTADAVSRDIDQIVQADTEEARTLRQKRTEFAQLGNLGTLGDFQQQQLETFGVPESTRQLKDIQLQLADIDTSSDLTKTQISGAAGQTIGQAQREVTQEDRENSVRRSGLAAQASVLQGNIETARSLVNDAVNVAYQDRTLANNNLLNQIDDLSGTVDAQTQQLLDQKKTETEAEQAKIQEVKDSVNAAMVSGATPEEVAQLTDINATDDTRLALAQGIVARGATEERGLDVAIKQAQLNGQRLDNAVAQGKIDAANVAVQEGVFTPEAAEVVTDLSTQLLKEPAYKEMFDVRSGFNTAKVGYEQSSGFGDIAMVNGYQRMIDPGAAVREGDVTTQEQAAAKIQQWFGIKGKILEGDKFTQVVRDQLNGSVDAQYKKRVSDFNTTVVPRYENIIDRNPASTGVVKFSDIGDVFKTGNEVVFGIVTDTGFEHEEGTFNLPN